ncbi:MAG: gamma-glutamylcyclotransferase [Bacteroidales bacterium]
MLLFVYGSLLRGMSLSHHMEGAEFLGPAFVKAELYFLGFYPGIIKGDQVIYGELYDVPVHLLSKIDEVEEYYENDDEKSVYLRKEIEITRFSDGRKINAEAYFYNRPVAGKQKIEGGDYRIYMNNIYQKPTWFACYENFLNQQSLPSLIKFAPETKEGKLEGFTKIYNLKSGINGYAYANLLFDKKGLNCEATAWKLNPEQMDLLDKKLDVPNLYHRVSIPFLSKGNELIIAHTFLGNVDLLGENLHPLPAGRRSAT